MKSFKETINIKGEEPVEILVFETHHGIVLDYYVKQLFMRKTFEWPKNRRMALAWAGYVANDRTPQFIPKLMKAKNSKEFLEAHRGLMIPSQISTFATTEGDIGFINTGAVPILRDPREGAYILDGTKAEHDWLGFVPFEDIPHIVNPKKGFIVDCNNKVATDNSKWHVSLNQISSSRAVRATEVLKNYIRNGHKITVDDMHNLQMDTVDILARKVTPLLVRLIRRVLKEGEYVPEDPSGIQNLLKILDNWDFRSDRDSVGATVYNLWMHNMTFRALKNLGMNDEERYAALGSIKSEHYIFSSILNDWTLPNHDYADHWCVNFDNHLHKYPCLRSLQNALDHTLVLLKNISANQEDWGWGRNHLWQYKHTPFSTSPLKKFFHKSVPFGGTPRTLMVSGVDPVTTDGNWCANFRFLASMKEGEKSYLVQNTGISGNVLSSHYMDQHEIYHAGGRIELVESTNNVFVSELRF